MKTLQPSKNLELVKSNISGSIVTTQNVRELIEIKSDLEMQMKALKDVWKALEAYMLENDIKDLDVLTIAEGRAWKVTGTIPPRFYKQVLDTTELNHLFKTGKKLPKGVSCVPTKYLTKTNRKVEA